MDLITDLRKTAKPAQIHFRTFSLKKGSDFQMQPNKVCIVLHLLLICNPKAWCFLFLFIYFFSFVFLLWFIFYNQDGGCIFFVTDTLYR